MQKIEVKIKKNQKIREFLLNYGFSKPETNKILKNKDVKVDGKRLGEDDYLLSGQIATIFALEKPQPKFKILFEDENVVVIDKGQGIESQGEDSVEQLLNGARAVHRLDRNTSGVMIFAKNETAEEELKVAFKEKNVQKEYVCEVFGQTNFKGEIKEAFLVKDRVRSEVKIYDNFVQGAVKISAGFTTVKNSGVTSIVKVDLFTGRTHQIRAHLAYMGYPIIGDGKYGKNEINRKFKEKYQKLHCFCLKIKKIGENLKYLENKAFISKPEWAEKYI